MMRRLATGLSSLSVVLALAACQSNPASTPATAATPVPVQAAELSAEQKQLQAFMHQAQRALYRNGYASNVDNLAGSLILSITVDRRNQVIGCQTDRIDSAEQSAGSYNPALAKIMERLCWVSVLPALSPEHFEKDGQTDVRAPLLFSPGGEPSKEQKVIRHQVLERYARNEFFWQQTLAGEALDSIGIARFNLLANAQGQVQDCTVVIDPHPLRRREFKQDNALVDRLNARCLQLDLQQMPGLRADAKGVVRVSAMVEYTPWRNRAPRVTQ